MKAILGMAALVVVSMENMAHAAPVLPPCSGHYVTLRTDTIKPGMMDGFRRAVAAHQAWYHAHRSVVTVTFLPVFVYDQARRQVVVSDREAMTMTDLGAKPVPAPPHDAAYDAFVAQYKATSAIRGETRTCMAR